MSSHKANFPHRAGLLLVVGATIVAASWALHHAGASNHHAPIPALIARHSSANANALAGISVRSDADVPVALLADYYEHVIEHAPPRQPGGVMQQRERFYRAPTDPFELLRSEMTHGPLDQELKRSINALEQSWDRGEHSTPRQAQVLESLATQSPLTAEVLIEAGRGFDFLNGDEIAAAFFRAGLTKAQRRYAGTAAGDPAALPFLHQLDQMKALWRMRDYPALAKRFNLAAALSPPLSIESRRAECLQAQALYNNGRYDDAARLILNVWDQDRKIGDLGRADQSDIAEMDWLSGLFLLSAKRYSEAAPFYRDFLTREDTRKPAAVRYLASCLRHLGRDSEADALQATFHVAPRRPATVSPPATRPAPNVLSSPSLTHASDSPEEP